MTTIYRGRRNENGDGVVTFMEDTRAARPLPMRLDLWNHSPTGFEWGYGGSGPAQLALALLAHALGDDERASRLHQKFKWLMISRLSRDPGFEWEYSADDIREVAAEIEADGASNETREQETTPQSS